MILSEQLQRFLLETARQTIRQTLKGAPPPPRPQPIDSALLEPAGCFVTLHDAASHRLRGCIGRLDASGPLYDAVVDSAVKVLADPRFTMNPVTPAELPRLEIELSILSPLKPAAGPLDFDLLNDGIYLTFGQRAGVFLPQVARETGWTKEQLLSRLCTEKMGLGPLVWQNPGAKLQKFTALVVGPEPFESAPETHKPQ